MRLGVPAAAADCSPCKLGYARRSRDSANAADRLEMNELQLSVPSALFELAIRGRTRFAQRLRREIAAALAPTSGRGRVVEQSAEQLM